MKATFVSRIVGIIAVFHAIPAVGVAAPSPSAKISLSTTGDLWAGQRITLAVELRVPGIFSGTPAFQMPSVPGALLAPPSGSPVIGSEEFDGTTMTTQRHEITLLPRRAGQVNVPPIAIRLSYKRNPLDKQAIDAAVTTLPLTIDIKAPPGAEKLGAVLSARDLKVKETWEPHPPKGVLKVGDAFTRTITFTATDVPGMAFPPFPTPTIDGIGIYRKPPDVEDHEERGTLQGSRREVTSYVCERAGEFELPAARLSWWDLDAHQLRSVDFPSRHLKVAGAPAAAASDHPMRTRYQLFWIAGSIVTAGLLVLLAIRMGIAWHVRRIVSAFRPVHLQPLN